MRIANPLATWAPAAGRRSELRAKRPVTILGMHRSGTSTAAGMLQDHGLELGPVSTRNRFNPRGNREIQELNRLHDEILERSGGSWWDPPERIRLRRGDLRRRDEILAAIRGRAIGVKDPRILVCLELWRDLDPRPIGVIRNPVAVRESLNRRARDRPRRHPQLSGRAWEELWVHYNRVLLGELERGPFPVIDFDRDRELDAQARAALAFWGLEDRGESGFFRPELSAPPQDDWRDRVDVPETIELWEALAGRATA